MKADTAQKEKLSSKNKLRLHFDLAFKKFKKELAVTEPYVYDLIKQLDPILAIKVKTKYPNPKTRYEIKFNNSYYINVPKHLYEIFPEKTVKHSMV